MKLVALFGALAIVAFASGVDPQCTSGGSAYIRWGRTVCGDDASVIYKGYAAGSFFNNGYGSGANYLCVPENPQWASHTDGFQSYAYLYGVEYELFENTPFSRVNNANQSLGNNDAPCAYCYLPSRSTVVMFPAMVDCPSGWKREYWGYLVTSSITHTNTKVYECLDTAPEVVTGGSADVNGALFYFVEAECGFSLPCPKYVKGWEVTCAVCSR